MPPYLYDLSPLKETLLKFIDMAKLRGPDGPRLVMTSTDIQNSQSVTFDSKKMNIDVEHIIACAGFLFTVFLGHKKTEDICGKVVYRVTRHLERL